MVTGTENEITADLIAQLLREQHPDLAGLPLTFGARGWDNQLWRLGDDLAVRLPWATRDADELLLKEHASPCRYLCRSVSASLPGGSRARGSSRPGSPANPLIAPLRLAVPRQPIPWRLSWQPCISPRLTTRLLAGTAGVARWPVSAKASRIC
jgi:hypothetical protein